MRSSHFTMPSITPIEMMHTAKNTAQHCHMGHALYINGPIQSNRLPTAVAPSHKPWQRPSIFLGATFYTNDSPSGEMNNSATVRKKYITINTHQPALTLSPSARLVKSLADG